MHIYKVLGSHSPLHPPQNSCQILHQMALSPPCSLLIFHITLHLVNGVIHACWTPTYDPIPKENDYLLWSQWLSIAPQLGTEILNILECWLVLSCAGNHGCAFMRAPFRACPEDSIAQHSPASSSSHICPPALPQGRELRSWSWHRCPIKLLQNKAVDSPHNNNHQRNHSCITQHS